MAQLRVAFVHPDLGIGGAERFIVDAAKTLQHRGHRVFIYTSHHSETHCFEETKKELKVQVHGDFLPRHLFGMFHLFFVTLRSLYLAIWLFLFCPFHFDVIIVDQIPFTIPILKHCADKVIFYCHFPDKLLAPKSFNPIRNLLYRRVFDRWEGTAILAADKVLANSQFTAEKFLEAFPEATHEPAVLYPGVNVELYAKRAERGAKAVVWPPSRTIISSVNRFERKKDIRLAIESLCWLRRNLDRSLFSELCLVIAGGYDQRVRENVEHLAELQAMCDSEGLEHHTVMPGDARKDPGGTVQVIFMPSISETDRNSLLHRSLCLVYTPSGEHFGIVPIEAMACGIPVIGINDGGPRETIVDGVTGYLCEPEASSIGSRLRTLLAGKADLPLLSAKAISHVAQNFSLHRLGDQLEGTIQKLLGAAA